MERGLVIFMGVLRRRVGSKWVGLGGNGFWGIGGTINECFFEGIGGDDQ